MIKLFTYGTLQDDDVQENIFGYAKEGSAETLVGYTLKNIEIEEEFGIVQYPIIEETHNPEDTIDGIVYEITDIELRQADLYEGVHYKRVEVQLNSGQKAWAYSVATKNRY